MQGFIYCLGIVAGFFVYRHLGLLGCNIGYMKRFLPLLILTGLLFGQDVLNLKSGESFDGTFYGKVGEDIVFEVEGETSTKKYSINDVETIVTKNDELTYTVHTYPFDNETKIEGNDLARIAMQGNDLARNAMQFLFNPNPTPLQFCGGVIAWGIVFIILLALNPGSDS